MSDDEVKGEYNISKMKKMKPGSVMIIEGECYRVEKSQTGMTSKHGSAKTRIEAKGVFNDAKKIITNTADSKVRVPVIIKKAAQVVAVMGDTVQLMDLETYETFDVSLPDEFKGKLDSGNEVVYWRYGSDVKIVSKK